ncbi:hypothetical protein OSTOST_07392 [Ostertagia ostertagi]
MQAELKGPGGPTGIGGENPFGFGGGGVGLQINPGPFGMGGSPVVLAFLLPEMWASRRKRLSLRHHQRGR